MSKYRTYVRPTEVDSTTIKQCVTTTRYKVTRITGAMTALGLEVGFNMAAASLMFGGAGVVFNAASKQKTLPGKIALGASGTLVSLAATYVCSESIDKALESLRNRLDTIERTIETFGTEDGYIYFYEYDDKQCRNPKKPILMKARVESLTKAVAILRVALSNKDSRHVAADLEKFKTTEEDITKEAWELWNHECDVERLPVDSDEWSAERHVVYSARMKFRAKHGMKPGPWLREHAGEEFTKISAEAAEIVRLVWKDRARVPSETQIMHRKWTAFKEAHGKDASDWIMESEDPMAKEHPDKVLFMWTTPFSYEIEKEAKAILEEEKASMNRDHRHRFIEAFDKTPEEALGIVKDKAVKDTAELPKTDEGKAGSEENIDE